MGLCKHSFSNLWFTLADLRRRIWSTTTGDCIRTLAEGEDAIWYAINTKFRSYSSLIAAFFVAFVVNMPSSPLIRSTSFPPPMTVKSVYGTTRLLAALKRMQDM